MKVYKETLKKKLKSTLSCKNKTFTLFISLITVFSSYCPVFAGEPKVTTDEAVYVNLDYYGVPTDTSIVKGCNLNGNTEFVDYGNYEKVTNMTNYAEPILQGDGVKWSLAEGTERFYYECTPKDKEIKLPWTFDISYKLNGVPKKAEELAGASGLVEINIECIPTEDIQEYYKNNMILQIATMVDMEDTLSIEAPGSQLQSMGTYKAIIFMSLPGEHNTFTMRIGTNSFETSGITMMMIPGTLEQLKDIKDIKEAKDTVKDSADAIYDSLDDVLEILQNMSSGIEKTQIGLKSLDTARETINSSKEDVYSDADTAINDLSLISEQLLLLIPHLQNGQLMIDDINSDVNYLVATATEFKEHLVDLSDSISVIQSDTEKFRDMLNDFNETSEERKEITDSLSKDLDKLKTNLTWLEDNMDDMSDKTNALKNSVKEFRNSLQHVSLATTPSSITGTFPDISGAGIPPNISSIINVILTYMNSQMNRIENNVVIAINDFCSQINYIMDESYDTTEDLADFLGSTEDMLATLKMISARGKEISDSLQKAMDLSDVYFSLLEDNYDNADELLNEMNIIGDTAKQSINLSISLIDEINTLNNTINNYKDDSINLLKDTEEMTNKLSNGINSTTEFLTSFKSLLKNSGNELNNGTQETLNGLINVLQESLEGIDKTPTMKNANDTIKKTIDDKLDKFENENQFLNLDAEMEIISFTSENNPTPESIQIILRTEEISIDDTENTNIDFETQSENIGIFNRIKNVFKKIWESIKSVF